MRDNGVFRKMCLKSKIESTTRQELYSADSGLSLLLNRFWRGREFRTK
jgi:hypothetical protein